MKNRRSCLLFALISFSLSLAFFSLCFASSEAKPIAKGALFPPIVFIEMISKQTQEYLVLSRRSHFSFREIQGSVMIVELFNTYCTSCPKNVPVLNKVYQDVENDPKLRGKVKIFSIATGNNQTEVDHYRSLHGVLYPVLADLDFSVHKILGSPRVPYTIIIKRTAKGKDIVEDVHIGICDPLIDCMAIIKKLMR